MGIRQLFGKVFGGSHRETAATTRLGRILRADAEARERSSGRPETERLDRILSGDQTARAQRETRIWEERNAAFLEELGLNEEARKAWEGKTDEEMRDSSVGAVESAPRWIPTSGAGRSSEAACSSCSGRG